MHQQRRAEVRRASFARPHAHAMPTRTGLRVEGHRTSEGTARVSATAHARPTAACCLQLTARAGGFGRRGAGAESSLAAWAQAGRPNQRQPAFNQRGASRREVRRAEGHEGARRVVVWGGSVGGRGGFGRRGAGAESSLAAWAQAARSNQRQPALNQRGASRREVRRAEGREGAGDGGLGWFVRNVSNLFGCDGRARDCRCAERPY